MVRSLQTTRRGTARSNLLSGSVVACVAGKPRGPRELVERLRFYDAANRHFAYAIIAGPAPFKDYIGPFRIQPLGSDRCVFDYWSSFEPADDATAHDAGERVRTFYELASPDVVEIQRGTECVAVVQSEVAIGPVG